MQHHYIVGEVVNGQILALCATMENGLRRIKKKRLYFLMGIPVRFSPPDSTSLLRLTLCPVPPPNTHYLIRVY